MSTSTLHGGSSSLHSAMLTSRGVMGRGATFFSVLGVAACGGQPTAQVTSGEAQPATEPSPSVPPSTDYDVHEWGLVDVDAEGAFELAAGAGLERPGEPELMNIGKPIMYFHHDPGAVVPPIDVRVRMPTGHHVEYWPAPTSADASLLTWQGLQLTSCNRSVVDLGLASLGAQPCTAEDHYCEAHELAHYTTTDAACLRVGEIQAPFLFYRGQGPTAPLPYRVERAANDELRVVGLEGAAPGGVLVRVVRTRRHAYMTNARTPAAGESVTLSRSTVNDDGQALREALGATGLTAEEVRTFMVGWSAELFGPLPPLQQGPIDSVIYLLPEPLIAGFASVELQPAPRTLRRVLAVRATVRSSIGALHDAPPPTVTVGAVTATGGLETVMVQRMLTRYRTQLLYCAEQAVHDAFGAIAGSFVFSVDVAPTGIVQWARDPANASESEGFAECASSMMRGWRFPEADEATSISIELRVR